MNSKLKQILAFVTVGAVAPIVGNAAAVGSAILSGDPNAHFTFNSCIAPAIPAMMGTIPAVLAALIQKYAGHFPTGK
jgi:hypothetical protein